MTIRDAARAYIALGLKPVPLKRGEKFPTDPGWQKLEAAAADVDTLFDDNENIGIILGGGIVDVDLDSPEAVAMADDFLPPTEFEWGRKTKPRSHRLYRVGEEARSRLTWADAAMIVELRGKSHQSMAPPSTHPHGEAVEFTRGFPVTVTSTGLKDLERRVSLLAVACVIAARWPAQGTRNEAALALAGAMLDHGCSVDEARDVIGAIAKHAGTVEWKQRARCADDTASRKAAGADTTGAPRLAELLRGDGAAAMRRVIEFLGGDPAQEDELAKMNARFFVVEAGSKVVVGEEDRAGRLKTLFPRHEFVAKDPRKVQAGKTRVPIGQWWLDQERRRQHGQIVFAPPPLAYEKHDYNLWKGFATAPTVGDWSRLRAHFLEVWCSGQEALLAYLLDWFALLAQRPGVPPEVAVVLRGGKGVGKSWPVDEIGEAWFGPHYVQISNTNQLTGRFNATLSGKAFVFGDEAFYAGDKDSERELKRLITEPTLTVERKGIDAVKERNCVHLIIAGNANWIAPVGWHERRFFVLDVGDDKQPQAYFDALEAEFDAGGAAAMLADMLVRPVVHNDVRAVPSTKAARSQFEEGLAGVERWWLEKLDDGRILPGHGGWKDTIEAVALYDDYTTTAGKRGEHRRAAEMLVAKALRWLCPPTWPRKRKARVQGIPCYVYDFPPLAACRAEWDSKSGHPREWPEPLDDVDATTAF